MRLATIPVIALLFLGTLPITGASQSDLTGQLCPDWVHDSYVAEGPDGVLYPTWHDWFDPVQGCYFDHEHGVNPAAFHADYKPAFGYTAAQHGMTEPHEGFKVFVFDGNNRTRWMVTLHMGTSGLGRACTRFHTFDVAVVDLGGASFARGNLSARLHLMADFGQGQVWSGGSGAAVTPDACPDNPGVPADGLRRLLNASDGGGGYEVWRVASGVLPVAGLDATHFTVATNEPMTACADSNCNALVNQPTSPNNPSWNKGLKRWIQAVVPLTITNPHDSDHFTSNVFGTGPGDVQQYIRRNANYSASKWEKCKDVGLPGMYCGATNDVNLADTVVVGTWISAPN